MTRLRIYGTIDQMEKARASLGQPSSLNEAITATGIDALFVLLDGGTVEIEGTAYRLAALDKGDTDV